MNARACVCVFVCVCVRACGRACVRVCVGASCVCVCFVWLHNDHEDAGHTLPCRGKDAHFGLPHIAHTCFNACETSELRVAQRSSLVGRRRMHKDRAIDSDNLYIYNIHTYICIHIHIYLIFVGMYTYIYNN